VTAADPKVVVPANDTGDGAPQLVLEIVIVWPVADDKLLKTVSIAVCDSFNAAIENEN